MAYANLIAQSCVNPKETFQRLRDFLCKRNGTYDYATTGIGWTLHDAVYAVDEDTISADDYFIAYSAGEDGQRDMYFQLQYVSNYINISGYLYWDASAHSGVHQFALSSNWTNTLDTNNVLWVYGDLDAFIGVAKYGTNYQSGYAGWCPESAVDQTVTTAAAAITAGSSVTVSFTAIPAEWGVGTRLFVRDQASIERVEITGISGTDVTFSSFVSSYSAGSKFTLEVNTYCKNNTSVSSTHTVQISHAGTKNSNVSSDNWSVSGPADGSGLTGLYPAKRKYLYNSDTIIGPLKNQLVSPATFTSETTHTLNSDGYRHFALYSNAHTLIKEV